MQSFETFIHFDDCDPAGILFFGNYYRLAHRALERFCTAGPGGWEAWFRRPGVGVPLAHSEANYLKPIRSGSTIWIHVEVEKVGETSITFAFQFREGPEATAPTLARVKTVHVFVDLKGKNKISVPEDLRKALDL